jgi:pimeloyl-ACP methyl ester carboxylesterase
MSNAVRETKAYIDIAGSKMSAIDVGTGDVVMLCHSYLWDAEMWRPQINALSRRYRVIVPNLWGHGDSGPLPKGTENLLDLALHHLALLDHLGIDQFALVGLSLGGMWGAELALLAPERVTALVLMGTFAGAEPEASRQRYFAMLDIMEAAPAIPESLLDAIVPLFFSPDVASRSPQLPKDFRKRLEGWDHDRYLDSVAPLGRLTFGRRSIIANLSSLSVPALVMTGAQDIPRPVREGRETAEALGCSFIELPGAGHISSLETPDEVNRNLLDFLSKARSPSRRETM